ncbi:TauD/TfdA family dioxygenase [Pelagibius sp.]|uniref:TauD/TfdA family dioxygenase n=1 Tax=Pelagibius sp. TaxID=1931238 RepID=UPI003BAFB3BF
MQAITAIASDDEGLALRWQNGTESHFSWLWLRDHDQGPESLDPSTLQRRVDTFALDETLRGSDCAILEEGRALAVTWPENGLCSRYSADFLAAMAGIAAGDWDTLAGMPQRIWSGRSPLKLQDPVPYDDILSGAASGGQEGLRACFERLQRDGFAVIEGVPTDEATARELFNRFGYIRETIFGGVWGVSADITDYEDSAYSTEYLEPHTDATYSHDAPGLQCFLCLEFDGEGGESILVDGFAIAEQMRAEEPELFRVLSEVPVPGRYIDTRQHLRAERPAIRLDGQGRLLQVSFNNYDRAPFWLGADRMKAFYRAYKSFHDRIVERDNWLTVPLRPGMALIFDNWRLLHGRMAYSGKRTFCGCYHNHEDFESALRNLGWSKGPAKS